MKKIFTLILLFSLIATGAKAETWNANSGDILGLNLIIGSEAQPGDTIVLAAGTYNLTSSFNVSGKELTFIGAGMTQTILDGGDNDRIFYADFTSGTNITIENLGMINGNEYNGGAVYIAGGTVTLKNCGIENCSATDEGGAIAIYSGLASATLINCVLAENSAKAGGAITALGDLTLVNTTIFGNEATDTDRGGGILIAGTNPNVRIVNSIIVGNEADGTANDIGHDDSEYSLDMYYSAYIAGSTPTSGENTNLEVLATGDVLAGIYPAGQALTEGTMTVFYDNKYWYQDKAVGNWRSLDGSSQASSLNNLGGVNVNILSDEVMGYSLFDERYVTTHEDVVDATDGENSLREAITTMTNKSLPVIFSPKTDGQAIVLKDILGTFNIAADEAVIIHGNGPDKTIIDGDDKVRIFNVQTATSSLTMEGVTLQGGYINYRGGAIWNRGSLSLTNCVLKENSAGNYQGGAIYNQAGSTILTNCQLINNQAGNVGGAIYSSVPLTLVNCALAGNQATTNGGAIYIMGGDQTALLMMNTTITGNQTSGSGGGLYVASGQTATILNSIIVGNEAGATGQDIYNGASSMDIHIVYSAYGDWGGTETISLFEILSGLTAADVFADPGNSLALLEGSNVATKGTLVGLKKNDNTVAAFWDYSWPGHEAWMKHNPDGSASGATETDYNRITTALDTDPASGYPKRENVNGIYSMGAVLAVAEANTDPGTHHELIFIVDEGIRINPDVPAYDIAEGHDYTFYMYMEAGNEEKKPYVTVNNEAVTINPTQDGTGWVYRIPAVYENKMIAIVLQDLVSNLNPEAAGIYIYSSNGALIIDAAQSTAVTVYNITGQAVAQCTVESRESIALPKGIYIVRTDKGTVKAIVR